MSHYGELEEVTGIPYVKFIKVDGNWYMEEDEEGNVVKYYLSHADSVRKSMSSTNEKYALLETAFAYEEIIDKFDEHYEDAEPTADEEEYTGEEDEEEEEEEEEEEDELREIIDNLKGIYEKLSK